METIDFLMIFAYLFMGGPPGRLYGKCNEFLYVSYVFHRDCMEANDFLLIFAYFFMGGPPCRLYGKCLEFL